MSHRTHLYIFFFFTYPPTSEIYTLSLHDALPISFAFRCDLLVRHFIHPAPEPNLFNALLVFLVQSVTVNRSEEHTSELQSRENLVCRLLLEKKKKKQKKKPRRL